MKIELIEGYHLTATRRRAIAAILQSPHWDEALGTAHARVGRITYNIARVEPGPRMYSVLMIEKERDGYGRLKNVVDRVMVRIS